MSVLKYDCEIVQSSVSCVTWQFETVEHQEVITPAVINILNLRITEQPVAYKNLHWYLLVL
jgi:hypothetical protein